MNKLDGLGIYGTLFHFSFAAFFLGSAALIFLYLWRKGRLDFDEEPAIKMLEEEDGEYGSDKKRI